MHEVSLHCVSPGVAVAMSGAGTVYHKYYIDAVVSMEYYFAAAA